MSDPVYVARASIAKVEGVQRQARLAVGPPVEFGVHGAIKRHFGLEEAPDLPLPVDYIAAATGA